MSTAENAMQQSRRLIELITCVMSSPLKKLLKKCTSGKSTVFAQFAHQTCLCATTGMSTTVDKLQLRQLHKRCLDHHNRDSTVFCTVCARGISVTVTELQCPTLSMGRNPRRNIKKHAISHTVHKAMNLYQATPSAATKSTPSRTKSSRPRTCTETAPSHPGPRPMSHGHRHVMSCQRPWAQVRRQCRPRVRR